MFRAPRYIPIAILAALTAAAAPLLAQSQPASSPATVIFPAFPRQSRINLAWQIALEANDFSPGMLDAYFGKRSQTALREYAAAHFPGLPSNDKKVYLALQVDVDGALARYPITTDDTSDVGTVPDDWNDRANLKRMTYYTLLDALLEKFHLTRGLLQALNPGVHLDSLAPGQSIVVPNLRPFPDGSLSEVAASRPTAQAAAEIIQAYHLTIDLKEKAIRAYAKDGHPIALFWCSVAKDKAKLPTRDAILKDIDPNPNYTFNPINWPEVNTVDHILTIPPGPRNPVGLMWMPLDLPGYGIHGTPHPELIGKTGSHGCFRMTNWDAIHLGTLVRRGITVQMINPDLQAATAPAQEN